jgi:lysophospholipase L1-like esterase
MEGLTYLALGDSYTIGEGVPLAGSFPYQTVQLLRRAGKPVAAPEIVAVTGWTTDELEAAMDGTAMLQRYDVVSLLIGVNNQYRGRGVDEYAAGFGQLLRRAIGLAGGHWANVFVLSIPDWGVTPFAADRDKVQIAREIDAFNATNRQICEAQGARYINITDEQRLTGNNDVYLAADRLHPSAVAYSKWAAKLAKAIETGAFQIFAELSEAQRPR